MSDIIVYKQEIEDGLEDFVKNNKVICSFDIEICDKFEVEKTLLPEDYLKTNDSINDPDLLYYKSILASVGMNKNHHYFLPEVLWAAKETATYKRVNLEHEEEYIIGADIRAYAVDFEGKQIPNNTSLHDLPEKFDIVTEGVIYRSWTDPKTQKIVDNVIEGMQSGKYSVSVETAYKNFDYVLVDKDGVEEFIKRNSKNAYLTKYYKNRQLYQGKKVGIAFDRAIFIGKGIVENPANPRSKIIEIEKNSEKLSISNKISDAEVYNDIGENMEYQKMYEQAQTELAVTKDKVTELNKQVGDLATANQTQIEKVAALQVTIDALTKDKETILAEKVKELETVQASVTELNTIVKEYKDKETFSVRVDNVQTKLEMTKEDATAFVEKFKAFNDVDFTLVLDNTQVKKPELLSGKPHQAVESKLVKTVDLTKAKDSLEEAKVEEVINPSATPESTVQANKAVDQIHSLLKKKK